MTREEIKATVMEIFEDLLDDESLEVTEETSRDNCEEWDSLFHMALMASIGEELSMQFKTEDIVGTHDIAGLIALIESRI